MADVRTTKIGVFKCGNIASSPLFEFLLDELADRQDIKTRTVTTGSKMSPEDVEEALPLVFEFKPDLLILISPNPSLPGPTMVRERFSSSGLPSVIISDAPGKRLKADLEKQGLGYIIITGDPLIGARREFLDPVEMALFNSNVIKVLAISGVYRMIHQEIDKLVQSLKAEAKPVLPRRIIDSNTIRDHSDFTNPYARAKAMAAYELTEKIAEINFQACFIEKEADKYIPLVASAHEMAQAAAKLAEEAREIEKSNDTLARRSHSRKGTLKVKTKLMLPPTTDDAACKESTKE
ncbi:MAG TPA: F420-dependent methylenetetrahydromethanopterin dehydrogenase [Candidatus Bathyarchaeia archaeon]|nr:F420-dependent methylenetetrahydromethanopterin dehydrogenase [Candidatus Bathyarchaeia archaeon]